MHEKHTAAKRERRILILLRAVHSSGTWGLELHLERPFMSLPHAAASRGRPP